MHKFTDKISFLSSTFLHFKGIGGKRERDLWRDGIRCWDDLASLYSDNQLYLFDIDSRNPFLNNIDIAQRALLQKDAEYFATQLPQREYYRIALSFFEQTVFLDIETTGLSRYYDYITVVGWSVGGKYQYYVRGDDDSALLNALSEAKCIVTFNGSLFDLPFLRKEFPNLNIPQAHVDLRFFSRRVGLTGGQKKIEKELKIQRSKDVADIESKVAPVLWYRFCDGDINSLKMLIKYNYLDITGMKQIFDEVVQRIIKRDIIPFRSVYQFTSGNNHFDLNASDDYLSEKYKFIKASRSKISLRDLLVQSASVKRQYIKVAGIDLTGSKKRASGLCFLDWKIAYTSLASSDEEIIEKTINLKPDIISIDSPLSLPEGRQTVTDDDPGRDQYGIMRICERILKKRGVNVYPSLIRSMQSLTQRGIKLANHFRSLGYPVIESFPGAAQDILGIPRKRTDVELLKRGLLEFGIEGEYREINISHDELDAITSALVGYFFWFGKFEALGNYEEEYLIIPDTTVDSSRWLKRKVIGISGPISTGKTTAGEHLQEKGFHYTRFSKVIENIVRERGLVVNRENLQEIGYEVKEKGQRWLCKELIRNLPEKENVVIDGLRHPEDHAFLVESFGPSFSHVYIDSPIEQCEERYIKRGFSKEDFMKAENHPVEGNVKKLPDLAHIKVSNCGSLDSFIMNIGNVAETITN